MLSASHKPSSVLAPAALVMTSALLMVLSFPRFDLWPCAWFSLVPLLFALDGRKPLQAFRTAYGAGIVFFLGTINWLIHVTLPGMIMVVLYLALFFGLFGLFSSRLMRSQGMSLIALPAAWVTAEYLRSNLLTGFGWALIGYSQYKNLPIIQIADITGVYGVSFLVVMVNVGIYRAIREIPGLKRTTGSGRSQRLKRLIALFVIVTLSLFLVLSYGVRRIRTIYAGTPLKIAVIQGNIPQDEKWDARFKDRIMRQYERLTRDSLRESPDLVIWPETAVPGFLEEEKDLGQRVVAAAKEAGVPLLVGAPRKGTGDEYFNSALLFSRTGALIDSYDKVHLVPFGEYIPFRKVFSFVERFAPTPIGNFARGGRFTIFRFVFERQSASEGVLLSRKKNIAFSCLICFEDIFPELARAYSLQGAQFLVNITNDAWFLKSSAPYQHAQASVFRAVETRLPVVRCANTGLSCFIDQKGRIFETVKNDQENIFVEGFKMHTLSLVRARTWYSTVGDAFAFLSIAITVIGLSLPSVQRRSS